MTAEYRVDIKTRAGVALTTLTGEKPNGFEWLLYTKRLHEPGIFAFAIDADNSIIPSLELDAQIRIFRKDKAHSISAYCDFDGFYRPIDDYPDYEMLDDDREVFNVSGPGTLDLLNARCVAYKSGIANRSAFAAVATETVLKTLVTYNATASGTVVDGRERAAAHSGWTITIDTDAAGGTAISRGYAWANLLKALQDAAQGTGGDFDLERTGIAAWVFKYYTGQRGTDRSTGNNAVVFSRERGTMRLARIKRPRIKEATAAIIGGRGEGIARRTRTKTGDDYGATNNREVFIDGRNEPDTDAALDALGDKELDQRKARQRFTFEPVQTDAYRYGRDYCVNGVLGDLVRANWRGISGTKKIVGVTVLWRPGQHERISLEVEDA